MESSNFIKTFIKDDLKNGKVTTVVTRYPPEPNGFLHIGHAFSFIYQYTLAHEFGGCTFLRFDDTNPVGESIDYVNNIIEDLKWLDLKYEKMTFASDYFDWMYEQAKKLIKLSKAYVDDCSETEIKEMRGSLIKEGIHSPYRNRSVAENLELFEQMKQGKYEEGEKVLRAKIDMSSPNMNMRDPLLYRIMKKEHYRSKDKWCIYPMYDFAHPLEDVKEKITHSLCSMEFENHRPLYNWVVNETKAAHIPRQIEFARFNLNNTVMSKRFLKQLVEEKYVEGWDDPRLPTIAGLRRRGVLPSAIWKFSLALGLSKQGGTTDYFMFEEYIRQSLKLEVKRPMAVIDPLKVTITNYPNNQTEYVVGEWNSETDLGSREILFSKHLYIEKSDFSFLPTKKWRRLAKGLEVRLRHAYFIKCTDIITDDDGNAIELLCTYDKQTKSGSGFKERKPNGTIHWVSTDSIPAEFRLYSNLLNSGDGSLMERFNHNSLIIKKGYVENALINTKAMQKYQFIRNGYFVTDYNTNVEKHKYIFNLTVSLKSALKPKINN